MNCLYQITGMGFAWFPPQRSNTLHRRRNYRFASRRLSVWGRRCKLRWFWWTLFGRSSSTRTNTNWTRKQEERIVSRFGLRRYRFRCYCIGCSCRWWGNSRKSRRRLVGQWNRFGFHCTWWWCMNHPPKCSFGCSGRRHKQGSRFGFQGIAGRCFEWRWDRASRRICRLAGTGWPRMDLWQRITVAVIHSCSLFCIGRRRHWLDRSHEHNHSIWWTCWRPHWCRSDSTWVGSSFISWRQDGSSHSFESRRLQLKIAAEGVPVWSWRELGKI